MLGLAKQIFKILYNTIAVAGEVQGDIYNFYELIEVEKFAQPYFYFVLLVWLYLESIKNALNLPNNSSKLI
jgi:hypothetical protein